MKTKLWISLAFIISIPQLSTARIVDTETWHAKDIKYNYRNKYFCNLSVAESTCKQNIANIKNISGIDIENFAEKSIKNVILIKIAYKTTNSFPATGKITSNVSGLLMLPDTDKPKGVILYYHPTVFNNSGIPSNFKDDNITTQLFDTIFASTYALNGYIVVAPDYIGQGDDYKNYHPYVFYPKQTVNTAVDLLNSSATIIKNRYNLSDQKVNLFSAGYSEGGAYSIWTAKCLQDKQNCPDVNKLNSLYNYKAAAGLSGAYDLSDTTLNFIIDNNSVSKYHLHSKTITTMLKPALVANAIINYLFYGNVSKTIDFKDIDKRFYEMSCTFPLQFLCNINGEHYNLKEALRLKELSDIDFVKSTFYSAIYRQYPDQQIAAHYYFPDGNNSMYDLFNKNIFKDPELLKTMHDADIVDYGKTTKIPLFLFTLKEDSVVTILNYNKFMQDANDYVNGFVLDNNQITTSSVNWLPSIRFNISDVDHISGEIYANIFAYKYFNDINNEANKIK